MYSEGAIVAIPSYTDRVTVIQLLTHSMRHALSDSPELAPEIVQIRIAQRNSMLMPTLPPGDLATRDKPHDSLTAM